MLCVLSCVSRAARRLRALADQRAARRLRALAELEPQPARVEAELRRHGVEESADAPPMAEAPSGTFATGSESEHQGVQTSSSSSHSQARPTPSIVHSWKPGDWQCPHCGNWNDASRPRCNFSNCPAAVWKRGDWECTACGNHNYASREFCGMQKCGAPRP